MTDKKRKKYDFGGYIDTIMNPEATMQQDVLKAQAKTAELNNSVWLQGLDVLGNTLINAGVNGFVGAVGAEIGAGTLGKGGLLSKQPKGVTFKSQFDKAKQDRLNKNTQQQDTNTQQGKRGWTKFESLMNVGAQFGGGLLRALPALFAQGGIAGEEENMQHVPIEAEGGEMIAMPWDNQAIPIEGASHEQGGVDLNVPVGSKIYSKRVKDAKGKSMAYRKERRDRELKKWENIVKDDPNNQIAKDTLEKVRRNNEIEEQNDLAYMELHKAKKNLSDQVKNVSKNYGKGGGLDIAVARQASEDFNNMQIEDREKFFTGGIADGLKFDFNNTALGYTPISYNANELFVNNPYPYYDPTLRPMDALNRNEQRIRSDFFKRLSQSSIDNRKQLEESGIPQETRNDSIPGYLGEPIYSSDGDPVIDHVFPIRDNTKYEYGNRSFFQRMGDKFFSSLYSKGDKNNTSNSQNNNNSLNNKNSSFNASSALQIAGIINNMNKPMQAFLDNFKGKPAYKNMYRDYGRKALLELDQMKDNIRTVRDENLRDLQQRQLAQVYTNNNNARDINTARAMNLATLSTVSDSANKAYANYANMFNQAKQYKAYLQNSIDDAKRKEDIRVDNLNREMRDSFYNSKLAAEIAKGKALQAMGSILKNDEFKKAAMQHEKEIMEKNDEIHKQRQEIYEKNKQQLKSIIDQNALKDNAIKEYQGQLDTMKKEVQSLTQQINQLKKEKGTTK